MEKNHLPIQKFAVNYNVLETQLNKKKTFKLADVKHRLEKVAFDVVRFTDSDSIDDLWQIQHCDDGDYIVAMYDDSLVATASEKNWKIVAEGEDLQLFYKNSPISRFSLTSIGLQGENPNLLKRTLATKLASNKLLVKSILNDLGDERKNEIYTRFPELA